MTILIILILIFLGLCFGSFVNAFIWRFHEQSELRNHRLDLVAEAASAKKGSAKSKELARLDDRLKKLSITRGRSMCVHCHHELAPRDLVPVFSFLILRGKCRYCGKPIPDTPLAETLTPLLFVVSYLVWPFGFHGIGLFQFVMWLLFVIGFVALALYDLKWQELPHDIVFSLVGLAVVQVVILSLHTHGGWHIALSAVYGVLLICGLFSFLYFISPKVPEESDGSSAEGTDSTAGYSWGTRVFMSLFGWVIRGRVSQWIGGGDIALGLLLGLLAGGPAKAMLIIFLASLLGTLVAVPLLATHKADRNTHLPFGPFLIAAAIIVMLAGTTIINWYTTMFILSA